MDAITEKILIAYEESILNERKFDLGSGHLGHGISVYNRAKEVHGDYEKIAHIDDKRKVKWYIKNPTKEVKAYVDKIVKGKNPKVSSTQSQKVFREGVDETVSIDKAGMAQLDAIVKKIIMGNVKKQGLQKGKKATIDAVSKAATSIIDGYLRKAMKVSEEELAERTLIFGGQHLKDNILDDITVEELYDAVHSNIPSDKVNARTIQKEFDSILKGKLNNAKFVAKKDIPDLVKELIKGD